MKIKSKGAFRSIANRRFAFGWRKNGIIQLSFAKHHGGEFVLRIEDTDQSRFVAGAEEYILTVLIGADLPRRKPCAWRCIWPVPPK